MSLTVCPCKEQEEGNTEHLRQHGKTNESRKGNIIQDTY